MEKQKENDEKLSAKPNNRGGAKKDLTYKEYGHKCVGKEEMEEIVERLCKVCTRVPDSQRTGSSKEMGIQNSYLWKGFN